MPSRPCARLAGHTLSRRSEGEICAHQDAEIGQVIVKLKTAGYGMRFHGEDVGAFV
jgi:hypothetical protein